MKKIGKIIGILLGSIVLILLIGALVINFKPLPNYQETLIPELQVEATPERIQKGALLSSVICNHCHGSDQGILEGKFLISAEEGLGAIYAPNITQHKTYGIGSYTDGELFRLLRTGVMKNGQLSLPMMFKSRTIADEDIYSLIAFLRSDNRAVQASEKIHPTYKPSFLAKFLYTIAFKPLPYPEKTVEIPDLKDEIAYGKYLVNGSLSCFDCHSASFQSNDLMNPDSSAGYLGGGNLLSLAGMDTPIISANITMDEEDGIGTWTEEEFITTLMYGRKPDGTAIRYPMLPYSFLDSVEAKAIYAYLETVPRRKTPKQIAPTK